MAETKCKYHPQRPARWGCDQCHINFCSDCSSKDSSNGQIHCPLCGNPAVKLSSEGLIAPFYTRFGAFFRYPFHAAPFSVIVGIALLSALIGYESPIAWVLQLVPTLIFFRYAYLCLANTADGHLKPPSAREAVQGTGLNLAFSQFFVILFLYAPTALVQNNLGDGAAIVYYILVTLALPASVMILAVDQSVFSAINPGKLIGTMLRIGVPYLALFFLLGILTGGPLMVMEFAINGIAGDALEILQNPDGVDEAQLEQAAQDFVALMKLIVAIWVLANSYFTLVMFVLMGYFVYQYHERLGYEVEVEPEELDSEKSRQAKVHPLLGDIEVLIKEGRTEQALDTLRDRVIQYPMDLALRDRFHRLLKMSGDSKRLVGHGAEYIGMLLNSTDSAKATQVYKDVKQADPDFRLDSPDQACPLAEVMFRVGEYKSLVAMVSGFHKSYPGHKDIPELYLLAARALSDGLNMDAKALPILQYLLKTYPDHPLKPTITEYFSVVNGLAASA